jgi:glycosyltransferase involved in cell wall biosynthesis
VGELAGGQIAIVVGYGLYVLRPEPSVLIKRNGDGRLGVLHLINRLTESGGAERFAVGLAVHLPQDRFESCMCVSRGAEDGAVSALADAGIPLISLGRNAKWDVHRLGGLANLIRRGRFDILHAHMFGSNLWGTLIGRACRVPVVIAQEHTWSYEGKPLRVWLDGHVIGRLATRFVAVSGADAERMVTVERVPRAKVVVIPSAYVPSPAGASGGLRAELGLAPDTPLVGTAVVMRPQKALHVLIDAYARVVSALPNAHLVLAGDGECRSDLERQVRELGLQASTHFLGQRRDVDALLRDLDVAAMSSDFEGTPLFVFECMAAGTPLVATAVGGLLEVVTDGRSGLLVPPRRPDELAHALISLLLDPERRNGLAAEAARRLQDFTIDTVALRVASLYESLTQQYTRRRHVAGSD